MSNSDHLTVLYEGVGEWNRWRRGNPNTIPDLSQADLSGLELASCDFSECILTEVRFDRCNLSLANFTGANLSGAVFAFADLFGAKFSNANLERADFESARHVPDSVITTMRGRIPGFGSSTGSHGAPASTLIPGVSMQPRYPMLRLVQLVLRFIGWTAGALGILGAAIIILTRPTQYIGGALGNSSYSSASSSLLAGQTALSGIVTCILLIAIAEFITLMLDMEENSRASRLLLARQVEERS